jgi:hypothetical protein
MVGAARLEELLDVEAELVVGAALPAGDKPELHWGGVAPHWGDCGHRRAERECCENGSDAHGSVSFPWTPDFGYSVVVGDQ